MNMWKYIIKSPALPYALLLAVSIVTGFFASWQLSVNADAVVYPFLFRDFKPDQLIFSEQHSNLFKFPLFFLQSILPYNLTSYMLVNILLFCATTLGVLAVSIRISGKKYALFISLFISFILLISPNLVNNLIYTTVRNIEFPIILWLVLEISRFIARKKSSTLRLCIAFLAFTLILAGDFYFAYVISLPIVASLLTLLLFKKGRNPENIKRILTIGGLTIVSVVSSKAIQVLLDKLGLYDTNYGYLGSSTAISSFREAVFSLDAVSHQLAILFNIDLHSLGGICAGIFISILLTATLLGTLGYLSKKFQNNSLAENTTALIIIVISIAACFFVYVVSGLSIAKNEGGISEIENVRYLTLIPLFLAPLVSHSVSLISKEKTPRVTLVAFLLIAIFTASVYSFHDRLNDFSTTNSQQNAYRDLAQLLKKNNVNTVLSGYWTGPMLEFWSGERISYATVAECNKPSLDNIRRDWFLPETKTKSAVIISMQGNDLPFLGYCSAEDLKKIYGTPIDTQSFYKEGTNLSSVNIWFYNYDTRSNLQHMKI